jgi:hypothetical protein
MTLFTIIPQNNSNLMFQISGILFLMILAVVLISIGIFLFLFFKTDFIIDLLKLDKGFDDDQVQFGNFNNRNILKLAIMIIGGFLVVDYMPKFLLDVINAFKIKSSNSVFSEKPIDYFRLSIEAINVLIGYVLITNYKNLANFLEKE